MNEVFKSDTVNSKIFQTLLRKTIGAFFENKDKALSLSLLLFQFGLGPNSKSKNILKKVLLDLNEREFISSFSIGDAGRKIYIWTITKNEEDIFREYPFLNKEKEIQDEAQYYKLDERLRAIETIISNHYDKKQEQEE